MSTTDGTTDTDLLDWIAELYGWTEPARAALTQGPAPQPTDAAHQALWMATAPIPTAADPAADGRGIRADELRGDDLLHLDGMAYRVERVDPLAVPVTVWGADGECHVLHIPADQTVVASRPSGWGDPRGGGGGG
jgi:hypothetical protein